MVLYIVLLVAVLFSMAALRTCNDDPYSGATDSQMPQDDTLRVAITYSPLSYYIYADTMGGLSYDMLRIMANQWKRPIKFEPVVTLSNSLKALTEGSVDILASMPMNSDLKNKYLFSESVFIDRQVLVQRKDDKVVKSVLDLAGDTIHIERGSTAEERLRNLSEEIGEPIHIVAHSDLSDEYIFLKIVSGEFRHAVINEKTARKMQAKHPDIDCHTPIGFSQFQTWVTRRSDTPLHDSINHWLSDFKATEAYRTLARRYGLQ